MGKGTKINDKQKKMTTRIIRNTRNHNGNYSNSLLKLRVFMLDKKSKSSNVLLRDIP